MLLPLRLGDRGGCNAVGLTKGGAATSESSIFTILFALPRGVTDGDLEPGNEEFLPVLNGGGVGGVLAFVINNCLLSPGFMLLGRANALSPGDGVAEFDGGVAAKCKFDPLYAYP